DQSAYSATIDGACGLAASRPKGVVAASAHFFFADISTGLRASLPVYNGGVEYEMLDRQRQVHHADVLFDSNVLRANDDDAEKKLHSLTDLLVAHPDQGNLWFSLMSLSEVVAPSSAETRIELLRRFRSLYIRFGARVRFMRSLNDNVRAECTGGPIPSA